MAVDDPHGPIGGQLQAADTWPTRSIRGRPGAGSRSASASGRSRRALETGELASRHARSFAKRRTFTDPAHQASSTLRGGAGAGRRGRARPLARYDALIA